MLSYEILKYSRVSCDIARGKALDLFFDGICIFLEQYLNKLGLLILGTPNPLGRRLWLK